MARLVIPGVPRHVTQRGAGRAPTFFRDDDYALYRALQAEHCAAAVRYVALNPVRARLVERAQDWSSARAHLGLAADEPVTRAHAAGAEAEGPSRRWRGELVHCH